MTAVDILRVCFWGVLAAYIVHILDETLMGGGFVQKVKEHWWPEYRAEMFFWFNAAFIAAITLSIFLYEEWGGHWVILPLFWAFERASHIITFHLWWSIRYKEYSPGLLTGVLFWIMAGLVYRYGLKAELIGKEDFVIGVIAGCCGGLVLAILPTAIMPAVYRGRTPA